MKKQVILYTDGGARPNPGKIGSGVHGYMYDPEYDGKIIPFFHIITNRGYKTKIEASAEPQLKLVHPIMMFDAFYFYKDIGTNNIAEIMAVVNGCLMVVKNTDPDEIHIITDSKVAINIFEGLMRDPSRVMSKSSIKKEILNNALECINVMKSKGLKLTFEHIKAHSYHHGNQLADSYATFGIHNETREVVSTDIKNYLKPTNGKFGVDAKYIYFETGTNKVGEYQVYNFKDDEWVGRIDPEDSSFGLISLKDPDFELENIIDKFNQHQKHADRPAIIKMSNLKTLKNKMLSNIFGDDAFLHTNDNMMMGEDVDGSHTNVIAKIVKDAMIEEANIQFKFLHKVKDDYEDKKEFEWVDITDLIYTDTKANGAVKVPSGTKSKFKYRKHSDDYGFNTNVVLEVGHNLPKLVELNKTTKTKPKLFIAFKWHDKKVDYTTVSVINGDIRLYRTASSFKIKI